MNALLKLLIYSILPRTVIDRLKVARFQKIYDAYELADFPESALFQRLVNSGDTVLDIGANIGLVTKLLAQMVGPSGTVHAFEPVPYTFAILKGNVERSLAKNVTCYDCAVSEADAEAVIEVPTYAEMPDRRDDGSLKHGGVNNYYAAHLRSGDAGESSGALRAMVVVRSIDSLFAESPRRISLVKCDAEGHELGCMLGARAVLERDRPALFIELCSDPHEEVSPDFRMTIYLRTFGYEPFVFRNGTVQPYVKGISANDLFFLTREHLTQLGIS